MDRLFADLGRGGGLRFALSNRPSWVDATLARRILAGALVAVAVVLQLRGDPGAARIPVVVAARALPPGTVLAAADLTLAPHEAGSLPPGAVRDPAVLTGATLTAAMHPGEVFTDLRVVGPRLAEVAASTPDARIVPIRLADTAVAEILRAGDRVDVIGGETDDDSGTRPVRTLAADAAVVLVSEPTERGRAELTSIWEVLTNNTTLAAFPHVIAGSFLVAGTFVAGIAGWWMVRNARSADPVRREEARTMWRPAGRAGMYVILVSMVAVVLTGDIQGKLMFEQQPMKMASAESLCHTQTDPDFSVLTVGTHNNCDSVTHLIEVPYVLPYLAEGKFEGVTLDGVKDLQQAYIEKFGPGDYRPNLFVTYWSFRAMIGLSAGSVLLVLAGLWLTRRGRVPDQRWYSWLSLLAIPTPFLANSAGWVFTEMGRQPWVVVPNPTGDPALRMTVQQGVSDHSFSTVLISLVVFTLLYGALAVVWFYLIRRYVIEGPEPAAPPKPDRTGDSGGPGRTSGAAEEPAVEQLSFAY
ncbi:cytochrome ubiquinol oxidase subunit I [Nocardia elegans]|uniref:cytochrome ubiquinol oxidase subunit I n=1 Tax=Nocardia elegans TaxID=300029 RepID=UPI001894ECE2|nr:cytochrome ubiquinol oxidase subunit I [Nocardia elegans]MBF6247220.1 cytochrome ubiquinol oxidase subunit I [Nocardia elegans]